MWSNHRTGITLSASQRVQAIDNMVEKYNFGSEISHSILSEVTIHMWSNHMNGITLSASQRLQAILSSSKDNG